MTQPPQRVVDVSKLLKASRQNRLPQPSECRWRRVVAAGLAVCPESDSGVCVCACVRVCVRGTELRQDDPTMPRRVAVERRCVGHVVDVFLRCDAVLWFCCCFLPHPPRCVAVRS